MHLYDSSLLTDIQNYYYYLRFLADRFVEGTCPLCGFHVSFVEAHVLSVMFLEIGNLR